jgi:valyl-tRNA synthetase
VFDTWATSSLTPQIAGCWEQTGSDLFARVFPMDMRPQAHDIIRTWLFATVVRSHYEHDAAPWSNCALSGWILDPDRKKMSKSKGNVVTPMDLFDTYGSDAVRYWALCARPGTDTAFSEDQMKVGRKLATKLLNVCKFVLGIGDADADAVATDPVDLSMLAKLDAVIAEATEAFETFDYARALERSESFFWWFCDDYVELVKGRGYGSRGEAAAQSARAALRTALSSLQRLLAPILPFAAEETWSWWQSGSIHGQPWPEAIALGGDPALIDPVLDVLARVRRTKTEAKVSQRAEVASVVVTLPAALSESFRAGTADLLEAGSIRALEDVDGDQLVCTVELAVAS